MPMHFFRMLQTLTSFLENMGAGNDVLSDEKWKKKSKVKKWIRSYGVHSMTS